MKSVKSVLKVIGNVLFTIVIILLVLIAVLAIFSTLGSNGRMMIGRYGFGVVATGSMEPELPVGSFILIERKDPAVLQVGDTITFYSDDPTVPSGGPVSHDIIRIESESDGSRKFFTRGCANPSEDPFPVRQNNILGKVVWSSVPLGSVIRFSQNPWLFPIIFVILLVNFGMNIANVVIEARKLKKQSLLEAEEPSGDQKDSQ